MPDLLTHAKRELDLARRQERDTVEARLARRQAAAKAWGYVCEQVSTVRGSTVSGPQAHKERKNFLGELDRAAGTNLLRDYIDLEHLLHGECFYESRCHPQDVERGVQAASEFPDRMRQSMARVRRR